MLVKPFEITLYDKLRLFFTDQGFVLMADKKQFRKVTPTGFQNVIFTATSYDDEIWLEVNFGCRNNQVEQIAQQFLGNTLTEIAAEKAAIIRGDTRVVVAPQKREAENVANETSNAAFQAQNLNEKKAQNEKDKVNAMPANSADRELRDNWQRD